MKNKKILALLLTVALIVSMLPAMAFAAPIDTHKFVLVMGTKAFEQRAINAANKDAIRQALVANGNKFHWVRGDGKIVDSRGQFVDPATMPKDITLTKVDGTTEIINESGSTPIGDLKVLEISAINATTIRVNFNKAPEKLLGIADFQSLGVSGAVIESVEKGVRPEIYTLTVKKLTGSGVVTIGGKTLNYEFTDAAKATGVKEVRLDNYRKITVVFTEPIDYSSATKLENYYLELTRGQVGQKFGAAELTKDYRLKDITPQAPKIIPYLNGEEAKEEDKVVDQVAILFDREARVGNYVTGGATAGNIINIKSLSGKNNDDKLLDENSDVHFSTRDLTKDGKKVFDSSVNKISIIDKRAPEVLAVYEVVNGQEFALDYTKKPMEVDSKATALKVLYNEPMAVKAENPADLLPAELPGAAKNQVSLNSESVATTNVMLKFEGVTYEKMRELTIKFKDIATASTDNKNAFKLGNDSDRLQINGLRDIAGNLAQNLDFDIKIVKKETVDIKPKIVDVRQVKDDVFAVIATTEDVTGVLNFDVDGTTVPALIPYTKTKIDKTFVKNNPDWAEYLNAPAYYFSLVKVETTGLADNTKVSYHKKSQATYSVKITDAYYVKNKAGLLTAAVELDAFQKPNMGLFLDVMGPQYIKMKGDDANGKLLVAMDEIEPDQWLNYEETAIKANTEDGSGQNEAGETPSDAFQGKIVLQIQGQKPDGKPLALTQELLFKHNGDNSALNKMKASITKIDGVQYMALDLKALAALGANPLPADFVTAAPDRSLIPGATYSVRIEEGITTDEYYVAAGTEIGEQYVLPNTNVTTYLGGGALTAQAAAKEKYTLYHGTRTDKMGFPAGETFLSYTVEEEETSNSVPQTSDFDDSNNPAVSVKDSFGGRQALKVLITGEATMESLKNLANYHLNGQTFAELGGDAKDVTVSQAKNADTIGTGLTKTQASYVIEVLLPANSIPTDGSYNVEIEGLAHPEGGKMAPLKMAVDGFKDNTSPNLLSAKFNADGKIELNFDETVGLLPEATIDYAKLNFVIRVAGVEAKIDKLTIVGKRVLLEIQNTGLTASTNLSVEVKKNTEGIMTIQDAKGNKLDPNYGNNKDIKPTFIPTI